jgi:hypothetical protein
MGEETHQETRTEPQRCHKLHMNTKFQSAAISTHYYMNQPQYTVFQSIRKYLLYRNQNVNKTRHVLISVSRLFALERYRWKGLEFSDSPPLAPTLVRSP